MLQEGRVQRPIITHFNDHSNRLIKIIRINNYKINKPLTQ